jgi:hypothetical protein
LSILIAQLGESSCTFNSSIAVKVQEWQWVTAVDRLQQQQQQSQLELHDPG